jgi:hypothetical protein
VVLRREQLRFFRIRTLLQFLGKVEPAVIIKMPTAFRFENRTLSEERGNYYGKVAEVEEDRKTGLCMVV